MLSSKKLVNLWKNSEKKSCPDPGYSQEPRMDIPAPYHDCQLPEELAATLREALQALRDFTGATAGWIGLHRPDGQLYFPARAGLFAEAWLTLQQGQSPVWGFEVREGPTVLNDPPPLAILGKPPLRNILSCLLRGERKPAGQLVLANKTGGFTAQDAAALRTMALFLSRRLVLESARARPSLSAALLLAVLDHVHEGIFMVDHIGRLVFANAAWADWTGYATEELCNRSPPFPFWVSHTELAALGNIEASLPGTPCPSPRSSAHSSRATPAPWGPFPFRHRNHSLFWCQMETTTAEIAGRDVTIAFLHRLPAAARLTRGERDCTPGPIGAGPATNSNSQGMAENLLSLPRAGAVSPEAEEIVLLLRPGGLIDLWDERWEDLTGLKFRDVAGIGTELLLDWLFPRQHDRSFVADLLHQPGRRRAQAMLEVAGRIRNRSLFFTFLPVRALDLRPAPPAAQAPAGDAWLILASPGKVTATEASRGKRFRKAKAGPVGLKR
jgi:PAS domain-containing protein